MCACVCECVCVSPLQDSSHRFTVKFPSFVGVLYHRLKCAPDILEVKGSEFTWA